MSAGGLNDGAIQIDRYDLKTWDRVFGESTRLQSAVDREPISGLSRDIWASLYKSAPLLCDAGSTVHCKLMSLMMEQSTWKDLRHTTQLDEYSAALGFLYLEDRLSNLVPEDIRKHAAQVQELEQQIQQWLDQADILMNATETVMDESTVSSMKEKADGYVEKAANLMETLKVATEAFDQAFDAKVGTVGRAMRQAMNQTAEFVEDVERMAQAYGIGKGDGKPVTGKERLELAEILRTNPKVQEIAKLAGRMQMISLNKRRQRTLYPPTEIMDISAGQDLAHVIPSELSLFGDPDTEDEFVRRYVEGRLFQYDLRGWEREGQGPIVVCVDESASTKGDIEVWQKALVLALFAIAKREKRAFAVVHFGAEEEIHINQWMRPKEATPKEATPKELVEMAEHFFNGGTDFERPLREAVQVMEDAPFKRGDIVFMTDGEANVSDAFLNEEFAPMKDEKEFHVISVVFGHDDRSVRLFSDIVAKPQLSDDESLTFIIEALQ